jgi:hypothetical protein
VARWLGSISAYEDKIKEIIPSMFFLFFFFFSLVATSVCLFILFLFFGILKFEFFFFKLKKDRIRQVGELWAGIAEQIKKGG